MRSQLRIPAVVFALALAAAWGWSLGAPFEWHAPREDDEVVQRARQLVAAGADDSAALFLRRAIARGARSASSASSASEWQAELERIDPLARTTRELRQQGARDLLDLAAEDRAKAWPRMAAAMEGLAAKLDAASVHAQLGSAQAVPLAATQIDSYFAEPDLLPRGATFVIRDQALELRPSSGALIQCVGERLPQRFRLVAELFHEGDQAAFGMDFDLRDQHSFLRAEIVLRGGQIEPRLAALGPGNGDGLSVGAKSAWTAGTSTWIPLELSFDGAVATLRVGKETPTLELKVPPREGGGRLGCFVQFGRAGKLTAWRALEIEALEAK